MPLHGFHSSSISISVHLFDCYFFLNARSSHVFRYHLTILWSDGITIKFDMFMICLYLDNPE